MDRRGFVTTGLSALIWPSLAAGQTPAQIARQTQIKTKVALLGQALIEHAMPSPRSWPGRDDIASILKNYDVCFSNFETVIKGPRAGTPTRELLTLHAAKPDVLDTLKSIHVNMLSTSNNHAFDLNTGGILDTIDAIRAAGIPFAGTGVNLTEAAEPAFVKTKGTTAALVAFATGKIREGGMATATRPGVNEVRRTSTGAVLEEDAERILQSIDTAKKTTPLVLAYHHNHDWETEQVQVPNWQQTFAKRCVDAGASLWVGHGVPMLQGIEVYKGTPLLYGLGSFIFQTEKAAGAYGPESWQSAIVECHFIGDVCASVRLRPVILNEIGLGGPQDMATRGAPTLAKGGQARGILEHMAKLSRRFGAHIDISGDGESGALIL